MYPSGKNLALTLTGLCVLGLTAVRPVAAQDLVYQLTNVTFNDGAVASGYFNYNPATNSFGNFDIITTNGITDSLVGAEYKPGTYAPMQFGPGSYNVFQFISNDVHYNSLTLDTKFNFPATTPGTFLIDTGVISSIGTGFGGSGEFAPISNMGTVRVITAGSFSVTNAVPEASTTVSFGLLLALGLGGAVVAIRKKKAAV